MGDYRGHSRCTEIWYEGREVGSDETNSKNTSKRGLGRGYKEGM